MTRRTKIWLIILVVLAVLGGMAAGGWYYFVYTNRDSNPRNAATIGELPLPAGYTRVAAEKGSFAAWLRALPLKERGAKVHVYKDRKVANYQWLSAAVVDMPLLSNDEQCADVCMRLRAEYLFSKGQYAKISFVALNGEKLTYTGGNNRKAFEQYMRNVFGRCNTTSLRKTLHERDLEDLQIGDIFVYPHRKVAGQNRYGHAMMVVDMAENKYTGKKIFLLVEGNTPAREMHVLRNLNRFRNPWFVLDEDAESMRLNVFHFKADDLRHF